MKGNRQFGGTRTKGRRRGRKKDRENGTKPPEQQSFAANARTASTVGLHLYSV